jgi:WD40 repeat protein
MDGEGVAADATAENADANGNTLSDKDQMGHQGHRQLLNLGFKGQSNLSCSAISNDGGWVCASDGNQVRLYNMTYDDDMNPTVSRIRDIPDLPGAHLLRFTKDSKRLVMASTDSVIYLLSLHAEAESEASQAKLICALDFHRLGNKGSKKHAKKAGTITSVAVSSDGQWLVSGDHFNRIAVFSMDTFDVYSTNSVTHNPALVPDHPHGNRVPSTHTQTRNCYPFKRVLCVRR